MNLVEEWMASKKKTYWRIWEAKDADFVEGTYQWVLFFTDDEYNTPYHSGIGGSEEECKKEIEWVVASRLESEDLL